MLIVYTVIWTIICFFMYKRFMNYSLKSFDKKQIMYFTIMLVFNVLLAALLIHIYPQYGFWYFAKRMTIVSLMWAITPIDYQKHRIPNMAILSGLVLWCVILVAQLICDNSTLLEDCVSEIIIVAVIAIFTFICSIIMKGSIGAGDIKLLMLMGAFQGLNGAASSIMFSLIALFFYAVIMLAMGKKGRKDALPFAPCALVGTYLSVFLTGM